MGLSKSRIKTDVEQVIIAEYLKAYHDDEQSEEGTDLRIIDGQDISV